MKRIIIESPYNPSPEQINDRAKLLGPFYSARARNQLLHENIQYARLLYKKALEEGHAPFASHLNYTQVWSEEPGLRERGIAAGRSWVGVADVVWFGGDLGISEGVANAALALVEMRYPPPTQHVRLFPDLSESQVREHLASLPWSAFVGFE